MRPLRSLLSPLRASRRLSVLVFHRVLPLPDVLVPEEMHAVQFDRVCGWLGAWFNVLPLDAAVDLLKAGMLPARAVCITFDDGYADNYTVALPILQRHGLTATFFIATGFVDSGQMWNDTLIEAVRSTERVSVDLRAMGLGRHGLASLQERRDAIGSLLAQVKYAAVDERTAVAQRVATELGVSPAPDGLMMTSRQLTRLRKAGMQLGAHTVGHPILAKLDDAAAGKEIRDSKEFLERLLGESVRLFAYPNGKPQDDYTVNTTELVRRAGFDAAVSTAWGTSGIDSDLLQMRRFTPWDRSRWRFVARMHQNAWMD